MANVGNVQPEPESWFQRLSRWTKSITTVWVGIGGVVVALTAFMTQLQSVRDGWDKLVAPNAPTVSLSDIRALVPKLECSYSVEGKNGFEYQSGVLLAIDATITKKGSSALTCQAEFLPSDIHIPIRGADLPDRYATAFPNVRSFNIGRGDRQIPSTNMFFMTSGVYPAQGKYRIVCDSVVTSWMAVPLVALPPLPEPNPVAEKNGPSRC